MRVLGHYPIRTRSKNMSKCSLVQLIESSRWLRKSRITFMISVGKIPELFYWDKSLDLSWG